MWEYRYLCRTQSFHPELVTHDSSLGAREQGERYAHFSFLPPVLFLAASMVFLIVMS